MTATKPENFNWINNLRLLALFAVIMLHTTAPLLFQYGKVPLSQWLTANFYNALVRFAVPVFVMITGALLLHREYELGDFLKKRLGRVIVPFLFWSLVYVGYSWYNEEIFFGTDTLANIKQVLHLLKYGSAYHLWYVYMLIGFYFFIPVLSKFVRNASKREIQYFLVVWLGVMLIAQPYLSRFDPQVDLHYFAGYAGYLVLGHYLAFYITNHKYLRVVMLLLFISVLGIIVGGTYLLYKHNTDLTLLYEPVNPAIVLLSSSVFLLVRFSKLHVSAFINQARDFACRYNFGIYLSHALILYLLDDLCGISYKLCIPLISIPVTASVCFILSLLLVWFINKLPFIGKSISG
jgi:surface polysaccharide O-acyltransferase-like enzyme